MMANGPQTWTTSWSCRQLLAAPPAALQPMRRPAAGPLTASAGWSSLASMQVTK